MQRHICPRLAAIGLATALITLTACSEDENNPKYTSLPPEFNGVELTPLAGDGTIRAGEPFVATAIQEKKGKLLYGATYTWSTTPEDGVAHSYQGKVVYDNDSSNPTDTIVIATPGIYTLRLNARYNISGSYRIVSKVNEWEDGSATYSTPSFQFYVVDVKHKIRVR